MRLMAEAPGLMGEGNELDFKWLNGDSLITRARNNLAHQFIYQTECDYLLFLDSDLDFTPEQIVRLISHRIEGVVCAQYPIKQIDHRWCWNGIPGEVADERGLLKVAEAGTGAMLIHRKVFEAMREKGGESIAYTDDTFKDERHSYFDCGVTNGRYRSEDWMFCRRARQTGFAVYIDTQLVFGHVGWIRYPLTSEQLIHGLISRCAGFDDLPALKAQIDTIAESKWTPSLPPI